MDMKCYEFRDRRRIFKWLYIFLLLGIIETGIIWLNEVSYNGSYPYGLIVMYFIVIYIIYKKTRTRIYLGNEYLKIKEYVEFKRVKEIKVNSDIEIITNSENEVIKLINLDRNYNKYKELLDYIVGKVDEDVRMEAGSADELLQSAIANKKQQYKSNIQADGKVKLGGWLTYFNVIAYFGMVLGILIILFFFANLFFKIGNEDMFLSNQILQIIQLILIGVIGYAIVDLLKKRRNGVKYILALQSIMMGMVSLYSDIKDLFGATEFTCILFISLGIIINIVTTILLIKIYIEYIDTFERPKQTLTN